MRKIKTEKSYTILELEELLLVAAELVRRYGDDYLIYFTFMEDWVAEARLKHSAGDRARALAKRNRQTKRTPSTG